MAKKKETEIEILEEELEREAVKAETKPEPKTEAPKETPKEKPSQSVQQSVDGLDKKELELISQRITATMTDKSRSKASVVSAIALYAVSKVNRLEFMDKVNKLTNVQFEKLYGIIQVALNSGRSLEHRISSIVQEIEKEVNATQSI